MTTHCGIDLFNACLPYFDMLRDPQRQQIISELVKNKALTVTEIADLSHLSMPAISHHLKLLNQAGLVSSQKVGTKKIYRPELRHMIDGMQDLINNLEEQIGES